MATNYLNLAEIDNAVNQNKMAEVQRNSLMQNLLRQKRQDEQEMAMQNAFRDSMTPEGLPDEQSLYKRLAQVDPMKAYEIQSGMAARKLQQQKANQEAENSKLENMVKKAQYGRNVMASVTPETWAGTRQQLIEQGFEFAKNLPETYDANAHKASVMDADSFIKQQGGGSNQEYVYQNTPDGIVQLGKRDGFEPKLVINPATGKPFVASSASPELQGQIASSKANANNMSDLGYKPQIRRAESTVDLEMKPQIESATQTAKDKVGLETEKTKNIKKADQFLSVAQQAKELLDKDPTGSGIGALVDKAGRSVGATSESSRVAARLETVSGWLVSNVPRMEGPQSNFDVENYKTMAGMIGDRTVPVPDRKDALDEVIRLQKKYKALNTNPGTSSSYVETRVLPDGRKIGKTKDGKLEIIK